MSAGFNFNQITLSDQADITKVMENFEKIELNGITYDEAKQKATTTQDGIMSKEDKSKLDNVQADAAIVKYNDTLVLTNGSVPSGITAGKNYLINGMIVNGTADTDFTNAIIRYWLDGSNNYRIDLIANAVNSTGAAVGKGYIYQNNAWSLSYNYKWNDAKTPTAHASNTTTYGVGDQNNYGHTKVVSNLTTSTNNSGVALNAYQGYLLNQNKQAKVTYSTTDLIDGSSQLATGEIYVVYEA